MHPNMENMMSDSKLVKQSYLPSAIPTARQIEYQDWEMGLFLHFGIRTFHEGHRDWDNKRMDPDRFCPAQLNCDQWIVSAKRAGMKYAVLVCKHHDGFANWPSKFSNYTVAQTPWQNGKGDVVREFTDACRRHDMKIGLYYSPAEWGNALFKDAKAYDEHFLNQITELLTNYGNIDILWFDGCGSEKHTYDWPRITGEIRRMQPNVLIFHLADPDFRWCGNETGVTGLPSWNTATAGKLSANSTGEFQLAKEPCWLPVECDCMMRWHNWFFEEADFRTVKPVQELLGLYYLSVGRGANLLINIGPNRLGLLPDEDRAALLAFGDEIRRLFGNPLARMEDGKITETGWEYVLDEADKAYVAARPFYLDHVIIQEDVTKGEAIRRFAVHVQPSIGGQLITVYEGRNIGHKAICRFPLIACRKVIVEITEADRPATLRGVTLHNSSGLTHQH
jgi:alpha-L-fucosidase